MIPKYQESIFFNEEENWFGKDDSLNLGELLFFPEEEGSQISSNPFNIIYPNTYFEVQTITQVSSEFQFQNFQIQQNHSMHISNNESMDWDERQSKRFEKESPKSIATKNVCYNICQKTIRVIQNSTYETKLNTICNKNHIEVQKFITSILREKKNFTGPKALEIYIEKRTPQSETFREFMKWFLKERYLRHCLTGDMNNKQAYIKFKNQIILILLD